MEEGMEGERERELSGQDPVAGDCSRLVTPVPVTGSTVNTSVFILPGRNGCETFVGHVADYTH